MLDSLGKLGATITVLSAACLILGIIHNTSYCLVIGKRFITMYSIIDHVNSSVEWLPCLLLCYSVATNNNRLPEDLRLMRSLSGGVIAIDHLSNRFMFVPWQHNDGIVLVGRGLEKRQPR
jgi:hypothetical protein